MGLVNELRNAYKNGGYLTKLIYINIIVFVLIRVIDLFMFLGGKPLGQILNYISLPSDINGLLHQPWSLFTYMFVHYNFLHILPNLLFLYWFGRIFLQYLDEKTLLSVYLLGGICGGLLYLIAYNTLPVFNETYGLLLGASASVFAIVVATAAYVPNYQLYLMFIGPVRIKYIALFYVVLYTLMITSSNAGGNIAHIGGAVWGFLFIYYYKKGTNLGSWLIPIMEKFFSYFRKSDRHLKVKYKKEFPKMDDRQYNRSKKQQEEETNRILDKIAKSGYESLSREEKNHLFKMGKK